MMPDARLFRDLKPGDIIEQPFRSGKIWRVGEDGMLELRTIPKRYRPPSTHRYAAKKRKGAA